MKDVDLLKEAKELFNLAIEVEKDMREAAKQDIEFALLSQQWDEVDQMTRRMESRPCLTINKLPSHIRQVVNDARQNKPQIKINPVDSDSDPKTAEILSGIIRNIENGSKADIAYDTAITQIVSSSFGYARVNIEYVDDVSFDQELCIERIPNQFSVYGDPYSMSVDGTDWMRCFVIDHITRDEFEDKYKSEDYANWVADGYNKLSAPWADGDKITICEYWKKEEKETEIYLLTDGSVIYKDEYEENIDVILARGLEVQDSRKTTKHKIMQYIITANEVLEKNEWAGKYIPIIPCYGEEVICEGKRTFKSLIRDSIDAQRQFNFWRTTATEAVAKMPKGFWLGEEGAFDTADKKKWNYVNVRNYSYLTHKKGFNPPAYVSPASNVPTGAIQLALQSADDLQSTMGMFDASIGARSNETSGKAIIARQRESDTGTFHFIDNLSRFIRQIGVVLLDLIPKVYSGDRVVRILGEDRKETEMIRVGSRQGEQEGQQPQSSPIDKIYDLGLGRYDVTVTVGPSFNTQRQESATQMIELMRVNPQMGAVIGDLLAKNLDWPGSDEIAERMKAMLPPQITGENPQIQQLQAMLQQTQQQSQQMMGQLQQQLQQLKEDKAIDYDKLKIEAYNAETNRLKTVQSGMTPEQIQAMIMQTVQQLMQTPDVTPMQPMQQPEQPIQQQGL